MKNNGFGIYVFIEEHGSGYSIYNHFYHNNFINNPWGNAIDYYHNFWDNGYPDGGNYWDDFETMVGPKYDDFNGPEQNINGSDGIIDLGFENGPGLNPYPVSYYGDRYPFMNENGWYIPL